MFEIKFVSHVNWYSGSEYWAFYLWHKLIVLDTALILLQVVSQYSS
jgi:hypothetical protein